MNKNCFWLFVAVIGLLYGCKENKEKAENSPVAAEFLPEKTLPPLEAGEVFFKGKDPFGETVELKGVQQVADTVIFRISEAEATVRDSTLVLLTDRRFMRFRLPDLKFLGYSGTLGGGPGEFTYPHVVPSADDSLLCCLFEATRSEVYAMDRRGEIVPYPVELAGGKKNRYSQKALVNAGKDDFLYADNSSAGKSIFRAVKRGDSLEIREIYKLGLDSKKNTWVGCTGDFVANPDKNRMAYAYKYFKIIKFMNLQGDTVRMLNFEKQQYNPDTEYRVDGMDANVTHYWGACAGEDYVYFLYSGRTPAQVVAEGRKGDHYIFVEQYDWNGNPVARYRLDGWGYFTVDEKNGKLYLLSTYDDDPFFVYDLPVVGKGE